MGIIEDIQQSINSLNLYMNHMNEKLDKLLVEKQPEDRTKVEEETKDSLTKNDGEDVTHNTGKVNKDG